MSCSLDSHFLSYNTEEHSHTLKRQLRICRLAVGSSTDLLLHLLLQFVDGQRLQLPVVVQVSLGLRLNGTGRFLLLGDLVQVHLLREKKHVSQKKKHPPPDERNDTSSLGSFVH